MRKRIGYINATALTVVALLFGFAALTSTPAALLQTARNMFATVGVSIAIAPNPYNTVARQLADKEAQLNQREAQVSAQEQAVSNSQSSRDTFGFYSLCMSAVLLVLVGINFYLDARRRSSTTSPNYSVDLR